MQDLLAIYAASGLLALRNRVKYVVQGLLGQDLHAIYAASALLALRNRVKYVVRGLLAQGRPRPRMWFKWLVSVLILNIFGSEQARAPKVAQNG